MATPSEILARPTATVSDTTQVIPVSKGMVYQMARDGRLDSIRVGRRLLIKTDSIRELLSGGDAA
jgi:excisionase family DNA binding protein